MPNTLDVKINNFNPLNSLNDVDVNEVINGFAKTIHCTYHISIRSVCYSTAIFRRLQRRSKAKEKRSKKSKKRSKMNTGLILVLIVQSLYGQLLHEILFMNILIIYLCKLMFAFDLMAPRWRYNTKEYVINSIVGSSRRGWLILYAISREIDCKPRIAMMYTLLCTFLYHGIP